MNTAISCPITFLINRCPHPDLLQRFLTHAENMEIQVNVSPQGGEPVENKRNCYFHESEEWFAYRIPRNADTEPEFTDYNIRYDFARRVLCIGSTGWDWRNKRSRWVGFDFDGVVNHGNGLSGEKLQEIRESVQAIPYVEVRRSTSGSGLHLYVMVDVETHNHHEHAALARFILGAISRDAGVDLHAKVDICGGNMWLWHRKMTPENGGLSLIKAAATTFTQTDGWKDHIDVVTRKRARVRVNAGATQSEEDIFEELAQAFRRIPLDEKHREIMSALPNSRWLADHHLMHCHTKELAAAHESLNLIGPYTTQSLGNNPSSPNCFAIPLVNGSWKVVRFGRGVSESPSWTMDPDNGWTWCIYNALPPLEIAAQLTGGSKTDSGGYSFQSLEAAYKAHELSTGVKIDNANPEIEGVVTLRETDSGIVAEIKKDGGTCPKGFVDAENKPYWMQPLSEHTLANKDIANEDDKIRCLETATGEHAGWCITKKDGAWTNKPASEVKMLLQHRGLGKPEAEQLMGCLGQQPWKLVLKPFQQEYPGNREWNRHAPQFVYTPLDRSCEIRHPHWDMVIDHVGADLTKYLKDLDWAINAGILTGGDYIRCWMASTIREPYEPTPYLFLFGDENCGKSIVHESFDLLVTSGVVKADRALTSQNDFNGELANAILCVVEEKDIAKSPGAHAKIKEAVTARYLSIRRMRTDSYQIPNMTHWIQCANRADACPVFPGDTRITMIHVDRIKQEIPKAALIQRLREEAPAFMRTLVDLELPTASGRLRIPVVNTEHKRRAADLQRPLLEVFVRDCVKIGEDALGVTFKDFYAAFRDWLPDDERANWNRIKVSKGLPTKISTVRRGKENEVFLRNCELIPQQ
jgi:hypothetical protein